MRIVRTFHNIAAARQIKVAVIPAVDFVRSVTAVVLLVASELLVDAVTVGAMEGASRTRFGPAHEGQQALACCQLPRLALFGNRYINALAILGARLAKRPETCVSASDDEKASKHTSGKYLPARLTITSNRGRSVKSHGKKYQTEDATYRNIERRGFPPLIPRCWCADRLKRRDRASSAETFFVRGGRTPSRWQQ